jgi:hypothetical protein
MNNPHVWKTPPAGQGSSSERICGACGARRSVIGENSVCLGQHSEAVSETRHEYDPMADD